MIELTVTPPVLTIIVIGEAKFVPDNVTAWILPRPNDPGEILVNVGEFPTTVNVIEADVP